MPAPATAPIAAIEEVKQERAEMKDANVKLRALLDRANTANKTTEPKS
jgi:hypothetical protein